MEIVKQCPFKSGYQPRPVPPPSAGWALSVLVAVCAVLWVWWMLTDWYRAGTGDQEGTRVIVLIRFYVLLTAPLWSNYVVYRWATRLMSNSRSDSAEGMVMILCSFFHAVWLFVVGFAALIMLAFIDGSQLLPL